MSAGELWLFVAGLGIGTTLAFPVIGPFAILAGLWLGAFLIDRTRGGGPALDKRETLCMNILRSNGFDARFDNKRAWTGQCRRVLRANAMGNYIGYTEFNRSEARRDEARRNF